LRRAPETSRAAGVAGLGPCGGAAWNLGHGCRPESREVVTRRYGSRKTRTCALGIATMVMTRLPPGARPRRSPYDSEVFVDIRNIFEHMTDVIGNNNWPVNNYSEGHRIPQVVNCGFLKLWRHGRISLVK
jgi:hypothetical protein